MRIIKTTNKAKLQLQQNSGFTLVEVVIAGAIMIILCIGILTVFSYTVKINRGENLRVQALSVLQSEVEEYRSFKFLPFGSDPALNSMPRTKTKSGKKSGDEREFDIYVTIKNLPVGTSDADVKFKEITIEAVPQIAEKGWLADLKANVTVQRVRSR